ncbi:MAG: hypothetical protein HKN62_03240 [Phycisphaerales bacterium]|nr:hypothetical protein [Phycisphaerales bacterium]
MSTNIADHAIAEGIIESIEDGELMLKVPGTDYRLRLHVGDDDTLDAGVGDRVRGVVNAEALRIHPASGGGRFVEPTIGAPRIVAGTVLEADAAQRRIVIRTAVPMTLKTMPEQDFSVIREGELVNCHVRSGATFALVS